MFIMLMGDKMHNLILKQYEGLIESSNYSLSILSNTSAFIMEMFENISWAGFYLIVDNHLILGPFQGKTACTDIEIGKGVCGWVAKNLKSIAVRDVHKFEGHIACDASSNSELVIPLFIDNQLYGVLDLDSTSLNRFSSDDILIFESLMHILEKRLNEVME